MMKTRRFKKIGRTVWALLAGGLILLLAAACSTDAVLDLYLQANRAALTQPASPRATAGASPIVHPVQFTVEPGTPAKVIAQDLAAAGLITDARLFEAYVRVNDLGDKLEAGTYTLSPQMTPVQIATALQHALAASITVTIPEGWRLEQTADYLVTTGVLDGAAYRRIAETGDLESLGEPGRYPFLDGRPAGASLEGYLFPDTYELPADGATAADLLRRQLDTFAERVLPIYQAAAAQGKTQRSLHEVLTLASIVEREAVLDAERPLIAGVYLNRLAIDMRLEADPTVQYAMGYQPVANQWWKTPVFLEEYDRVDSPYNTYLHAGLPPGPIASPGLRSIEAALNPAEHDYLFFVATPTGDGRHVFAKTFAEHQENMQRYRDR